MLEEVLASCTLCTYIVVNNILLDVSPRQRRWMKVIGKEQLNKTMACNVVKKPSKFLRSVVQLSRAGGRKMPRLFRG